MLDKRQPTVSGESKDKEEKALHHKVYLKKKDDHDKEKPKQHFFLFIPHISLNNIAIMFVFKSHLVMNRKKKTHFSIR
ncbi:hypothetical protein QWV57_13595 [Geobacillus zalihae]|uniref:Uncharacterized protein n=1 Tax=Geobacillus zalihae TaxID=213419 RepID=A0A7H1RR31_9BACL|nr:MULTISPECIES: hypothetical protein [Geobacillus]OQP19110.1 hypothetical protein B1694_15270 [Geobacillus zalihae]QNU16720.1 hypothetical protein IC807_09490 [Geobacillus zalihae]RXS86260.1 hypothetical protein ETR37_12770 [Geobacillus sp. PK12]WKA46705.1 hypothetical protein QWV57_13595 [Geobacillus zalihae]